MSRRPERPVRPPMTVSADLDWQHRMSLERRATRCHSAGVRLFRGAGPTAALLTSNTIIPPPPPIPADPMRPFVDDPRQRLRDVRRREGRVLREDQSDHEAAPWCLRDTRSVVGPSVPCAKAASTTPKQLPMWEREPLSMGSRSSSAAGSLRALKSGGSRRNVSFQSEASSASSSLRRRVDVLGGQLEQQNEKLAGVQSEMERMSELLAIVARSLTPAAAVPSQR